MSVLPVPKLRVALKQSCRIILEKSSLYFVIFHSILAHMRSRLQKLLTVLVIKVSIGKCMIFCSRTRLSWILLI